MKLKKVAGTVVLSYLVGASWVSAAPGYNGGGPLPSQFDLVIDATQHGVNSNDGVDDSDALQAIIDNMVPNNPDALTLIQLPAGEINLSDEIHVDKSGLVIRGAGSDPVSGTKIVVKSWSPYGVGSDNAPDFDKKYWPGFAVFRVETRQMHAKEQAYEGSINFHWKHSIEFAETASIGDTSVVLESGKAKEFSVGDFIYIGAASDKAFLDKGQVPTSRRSATHIMTGHMRTQIFKVLEVDISSDEVTLDRPLEFNLPLNNESGYNSRAMPVTAIQNFGLQDFYLTMDTSGSACEGYNTAAYSPQNPNGVLYRYENVCSQDAIHGVILKWVQNGWVKNLNIEMIGSHPIVTEFAKDVTISDNNINGSWNKGAGGNGYFRGSKLYDSWIKDNTIKNIRHLALQWSATGNIVENNYLNEDLNLHGGWERNNLIRNNTVEVPFEHRSWSNGAPEAGSTWQPIWVGSGDHASKWSGPTGPNNVLLNNTFKKAKSAGQPIETWGLFDTPNVEYALGWNGSQFEHLNVDGAPIATWNQLIAEGVFAQIPHSGVNTAGGSWQRPVTEPSEPEEPVDPPVNADCSEVLSYAWGSKQELIIHDGLCLQIDRPLGDKTVQVWDSDTNSSCDFRGMVRALDDTSELVVSSNYVSTKSLIGSLLSFNSSNGCNYLKFRAY
ncbi:right-handed parallel beta-helix repeat-containing protein [Agarivorans aestuarii]|uniref:right-handed parallel beta-helix repeat-containing protein n=1 Tax=Agarivorans aestuarii TaxID=1563703 RepID=UPI001C81A5E3|nr:right-handed parallel beta-helix repeat-containing protein [Agarivorans aestuarii]